MRRRRSAAWAHWVYSLDFNEKCPNVAYLIDFHPKDEGEIGRLLHSAFSTSSNRPNAILNSHRNNVMHEAAKLKPIVIDESLTGQDRLHAGSRNGLHRRGAEGV